MKKSEIIQSLIFYGVLLIVLVISLCFLSGCASSSTIELSISQSENTVLPEHIEAISTFCFLTSFGKSTKQLVEKCWNYGFVKVTPFFPETCMYVAQYVQKKLYGDNKDFFRLPEFMRCSQHLGEKWLYDHMKSIDDEHPYISMDGFKYGIPGISGRFLKRKEGCISLVQQPAF